MWTAATNLDEFQAVSTKFILYFEFYSERVIDGRTRPDLLLQQGAKYDQSHTPKPTKGLRKKFVFSIRFPEGIRRMMPFLNEANSIL
jgi:hypothetical protein